MHANKTTPLVSDRCTLRLVERHMRGGQQQTGATTQQVAVLGSAAYRASSRYLRVTRFGSENVTCWGRFDACIAWLSHRGDLGVRHGAALLVGVWAKNVTRTPPQHAR